MRFKRHDLGPGYYTTVFFKIETNHLSISERDFSFLLKAPSHMTSVIRQALHFIILWDTTSMRCPFLNLSFRMEG